MKAGLKPPLFESEFAAVLRLAAEGGGRAGREAGKFAEEARPGGGGYDMMNAGSYTKRVESADFSNVPDVLFRRKLFQIFGDSNRVTSRKVLNQCNMGLGPREESEGCIYRLREDCWGGNFDEEQGCGLEGKAHQMATRGRYAEATLASREAPRDCMTKI